MTFLNPFLLWGMAAVAAPIIIHMFMNRRIKPVVWAAMRFLQVSIQKNQKRMNLEDLLLLLLRCLIFILLALALARPIFKGSKGGSMVKGSETAVLLIDNSYSMGQSDGGATRFDQARDVAQQILDSLPQGSSVALLYFSDVVKAAVPDPSFDLNLVRKLAADAQVSDRPTNVEQGVKQALDVLDRHQGGTQHIYLITDGQEVGWKQFDDIAKMLRNPSVRSSVILVGSTEDHNLCVNDLRMETAIASVGEASQFDVEVTNFGTSEAKDVAVRLSVDNEPASDEGVIDSIPVGAGKRISLFTKFATAGYHTVTGEVNADHLPIDDQRTIALRALDDVRVLLVTSDEDADPTENATFYLRHALTPVAPAEVENYYIKTKTISPSQLDTTNLGDYEAVVLADVADVSQAALDGIAAYLNRGGGLIVFPGDKTQAQFYNDNLVKKYGFLPASLGKIRGEAGKQDKFLSLQAKGYENHIVSIWKDPNAGTLASTHFYRAYELKPEAGHTDQAGEPEVIVKYADSTPAIMERPWGRGHVILFSSSANTAWNDMPLRPVYLPLMERVLGSILDQQDERLNVPVGSQLELVCNPEWTGKDAIITHVGEKKESGSLRRINIVNGVPLLRFDETEKAGPYEAAIKTEPPTIIKFAAQFDPSESNLTAEPQAELDSLAPDVQVVRWGPNAHLDGQAGKEGGNGAEIWVTLAVLVLIAACGEMVMGGIFSASK